jgi:hypothetical protein
MTPIELSFICTSLLAMSYYIGVHFGKTKGLEDAVEFTLDTLEKGNFIKFRYNKETKEKELIPLDKLN